MQHVQADSETILFYLAILTILVVLAWRIYTKKVWKGAWRYNPYCGL